MDCMMDPWMGVRKWGAKVVQHAAAASGVNGVFDQLPYTGPLKKAKSITVKLDDTGLVDRALDAYTFGRNCNFLPIPFAVRDERKNVILHVELVAGVGIDVYNLEERERRLVMRIVLPLKCEGHLQYRIQHPTTTAIYAVHTANHTGSYAVQNTVVSPASTYLSIDKELLWSRQLPHMLGIGFDDAAYVCKSRGKMVGRLSPKISPSRHSCNSMSVKFKEDADEQQRVVMVAVALLQLLSNGYAQVLRILRDSMPDEGRQ